MTQAARRVNQRSVSIGGPRADEKILVFAVFDDGAIQPLILQS
jgi:hypothetical protein